MEHLSYQPGPQIMQLGGGSRHRSKKGALNFDKLTCDGIRSRTVHLKAPPVYPIAPARNSIKWTSKMFCLRKPVGRLVPGFHWPYCEKRCTYCNFNKYINPSVDHERMRKCLVTETQSLLEISGVSLIKSIFFGGGTPSLAHPETIGKVIETVKRSVNLAADAERWNFFSPDASLLDVFSEAHMIKVLQKEGYLHSLSGGLRATSRGLNLADGLTKELFLILERFWEMHRKADQ
ncbi:hypothetical protein CAPTEDRAFT_209904 [Capitella teleta]|uniref:Radical SAM core domain-containing protein n=1 Tax=Capitella teleta TaxID=283909 RepID=R7UAL9_CAPTE|nr:hypothetical protein CAPTEDRAFT_209904 [Capitella teleta]|eukprot:ELU03176.1 hypothetical protein CAPTEDRAFT_209904 [Capitella teleta]